ncbi:MAG: HlyD family efflux transporter periplasmic adaptor subunit [Bacteroidetes bacterium]|nr:HlyD family efflux transporter periplasmic adaptor subunit [Bacteroidota bacterium]MBI3483461.1 HlyD family efflux transporter periplasmic adaptor subunit [Bacteroidota bacterium]
MDKKIEKKRFTVKKVATYLGSAALILFIAYQFIFADRRSKLKTEKDKITISEVKMGLFKEYIPQTGTVEPARTVYLDAIEGGNIRRVIRESGSIVKKGDPILEITNLNREIAVLQQESELVQSINRSRDTRLGILRNDLEQRQTLAQIDNQLAIFRPQYERQKVLLNKKLIAKQDFEKTEADYLYNVERRKFTYEAYRRDSVGRILNLQDIDVSENRMKQNLIAVRTILENLNIKAPVDGQLTMSAHWETGQAINTAQRLGQVDIVGSYKVRVPIDELYLPKISTGLPATTDFDGKTYNLEIKYIYPNITNGRFEVDMEFTGETPQGIRRGQSLRLRIELGQPSQELLLPMGGFYKDTGGNWVFIVEPGTDRAVKREVKLGRKMGSEYFEVLEGLKPGDKVITSSYENFGNNEVLILN